jgi:hypothetical protein
MVSSRKHKWYSKRMPPTANFRALRRQIDIAVNEVFNSPPLNTEGGYSMIEGFITQSIQPEIGGNIGMDRARTC